MYLNKINHMKFTELCNDVFITAINDYHKSNSVNTQLVNPYEAGSLNSLLYHKCWIDTVQWHLEDIIRNPNIDPVEALKLKRTIDASNQERTDMVEYIDSYFLLKYADVVVVEGAKINTESPAWACDRLSILHLKIYHMKQETLRDDVSVQHILECQKKLDILMTQLSDLTTAIEELIEDLESGHKYMKVYKQMKMYNDPALNPVLYAKE